MSDAPVTVVIVTYQSAAAVGHALASIRPSHQAGLVAECLVVDNRSADGTAALVRREHPWVRVIDAGANLGFGRANNLGLAQARARYALLLNPDATLPRPDLERLVAFLDATPRAGVAAPAIRQPDGRLQFAGGLPTPRAVLLEALGRQGAYAQRRTIVPGGPPFRTDWVCGAAALVRREMLEEVGAFDPRYFLYFEETDLWRRAQGEGWELWAVGEALATHIQAASARAAGRPLLDGCLAEHYLDSRALHLTTHFGWPVAAAVELAELGALGARIAGRLLRRRSIDDLRPRLHRPRLARAREAAP